MHRFDTLAADLAPLLKMSGDSGDTGDKLKSQRLRNDLGDTIRCSDASPLDRRVVTTSKFNGDAKSNVSQSFREGVTSVTSASSDFEQSRTRHYPTGWHAILCEQKDPATGPLSRPSSGGVCLWELLGK